MAAGISGAGLLFDLPADLGGMGVAVRPAGNIGPSTLQIAQCTGLHPDLLPHHRPLDQADRRRDARAQEQAPQPQLPAGDPAAPIEDIPLPGLREQRVCISKIIHTAAVPVVIAKIVEKFFADVVLAVVRQGRIAKAVGQQAVVPVIHGQEQQHAVPVFAHTEVVTLKNVHGNIEDRSGSVVPVVLHRHKIHGALLFLGNLLGIVL